MQRCMSCMIVQWTLFIFNKKYRGAYRHLTGQYVNLGAPRLLSSFTGGHGRDLRRRSVILGLSLRDAGYPLQESRA